MFDFSDLYNFGREITAHGEKWQSVKYFQNRYHLAVRVGAKLPIQCFVVQEDVASAKQDTPEEP